MNLARMEEESEVLDPFSFPIYSPAPWGAPYPHERKTGPNEHHEIPARVGVGPEPPVPSTMRRPLRSWLMYEVFTSPDEPLEGPASFYADRISYALERRFEDTRELAHWIGAQLTAQSSDEWEVFHDFNPTPPPPSYTGVGFMGPEGAMAVVLTGPANDDEAIRVAHAFREVPTLIDHILAALETP